MILTRSPLQVTQEVPLHGGRPNPLAPSQATPVDAVQVLLVDHLLETFTGPLARLHARQALAKAAAAIQTAALAYWQVQNAATETPVVVPDLAPAPAFVPKMRSPALGARYGPGIPRRYRPRSAAVRSCVIKAGAGARSGTMTGASAVESWI